MDFFDRKGTSFFGGEFFQKFLGSKSNGYQI